MCVCVWRGEELHDIAFYIAFNENEAACVWRGGGCRSDCQIEEGEDQIFRLKKENIEEEEDWKSEEEEE